MKKGGSGEGEKHSTKHTPKALQICARCFFRSALFYLGTSRGSFSASERGDGGGGGSFIITGPALTFPSDDAATCRRVNVASRWPCIATHLMFP